MKVSHTKGEVMKHNLLLAFSSLALVVSTAQAQFRPMPPDPYDAHQAAQAPLAPNTTNAPAQHAAAQPAYPAANDYPSGEVQAIPPAKARFAVARAEFDNAQTTLHRVVDTLKEDFEYSADVVAAAQNEKLAYDRYSNARGHVLQQLNLTADYGTLRNLVKDLNDRLHALRANPTANKAEIVATAQLKLAYATRMSEMESDALKADSGAQTARTQLVEASTKLTELRAKFQRSIKRDQTFVAARNQMDDARINRVGAAAYLEGAYESRNIALDYALYLHRHDPYTYRYNPSYGYPYDSGY